ncbi:hypothetical protein BKA56DRAFT_594262 [Ilyonectria sp. MPI-CAGE-AT-0026]|nr:hypothetical protein BKA56DRAFT_594262 [Ilyonectria sp. MPI-CAGE-AT-0026]
MPPHLVQSFQPSPPHQETPPNSPLQKPTDGQNPVTFNRSFGINGKGGESSLAERLFTVLEKLADERPTSHGLSSSGKAPTEAKEPQAEQASRLVYKNLEKRYDNQYATPTPC